MPLSFRQAGNTFIQGPNISIYPSGNSYAISGNATSTGSTGFSAITSAGTGNRLLLSSITNNALIYKSLTGTSNLSINDDENGTLIFSLAGGTGTIISGVNIGTNANSLSFFSGLSTTTNPNDTLAFRNILAGPNIFINTSVVNDGDILISRGSPILVNQLSNIGGGARVLSSITTTNLLVARTISGANGFSQTIVNAANAATDSDATAFITAASITSTTQIQAINNLVFDLKAANLWNKMLAVYPFVGGTENSHKYNLKDPRDLDGAFRLSFTTGWTHNASGATPNGTTAYANTFLTPSTALTNNNTHLSVYPRLNNLASGAGMIGAASGASFIPLITIYQAQVGGSQIFDAYSYASGAGRIQITNPNYRGHLINSRISNTDFKAYSKGILTGSNLNISTDDVRGIPFPIFIGGLNLNGTPSQYSNNQFAFASIGSGLTASEASTFSTMVEAYQTTLSRQVVVSTARGVNTVVNISPTNTTANRLYISNATSQLAADANFGADATSGSLSIGSAVSTTSRLLLAAGTGAISQIRLTAFSAEPTNPSDGDIWYSTSGNTLKFYKNNISTDFIFKDNNLAFSGVSNSVLVVNTAGTISGKYINSFGIFNALESKTNIASETSIISSVITGSTTLLASTNVYNPQLGIGRKYRFNARGIVSFITPDSLNIIIKLGSTIICSSSTIGVGSIDPYSSEIEIDATFTIRNSGLVVGSGKILFLTSPPSTLGGDPVIFGIYSQDATIDTTSNKVFDCISQVSFEDFSNTITIYESTLEILN
jgi:hypothetical protein